MNRLRDQGSVIGGSVCGALFAFMLVLATGHESMLKKAVALCAALVGVFQ
jgi:hypothetical protein